MIGDLGLHAAHLPLRLGRSHQRPGPAEQARVRAARPDGKLTPCETWDNAIMACEGQYGGDSFPLTISTKRIAPGHQSTWFVRVWGTALSAEFSTKSLKQVRYLPYEAGGEQAWRDFDVPFRSAYPTITGDIFEFGFTDVILQMWAAFCDELANGRDRMNQPFHCATPEELGHVTICSRPPWSRAGLSPWSPSFRKSRL